MSKTFKQISRIERLDDLIRRKSTGTPAELASKMGVSKRSIYDLMDELRAHGAIIQYNKFSRTYYYLEDFAFPYKTAK